jgi:hypothetical protein
LYFQAQPSTIKPSTIYKNAIHDVEQLKTPNLDTVRDRIQVYNARRKDNSISAEYLAVMKRLEKQNGIVARFSMSRAEAPVIVLAQGHLIKEINRCCVSVTAQTTRSVLCEPLCKNL